MIDFNMNFLNRSTLASSFFCLDPSDPTVGFYYDATSVFGHTWPKGHSTASYGSLDWQDSEDLVLRLRLGSHLAQHLRLRLEEHKGYTSTVGISTNKLLSKLVGNVNKPKGQTTLMPPYSVSAGVASHVHEFIDNMDIGKIPGIGFKIAQKVRQHVLGRPAAFDAGLVYGGTKESVTAGDVRLFDGMGSKLLEKFLHGPGMPRDLPSKVWGLVNGVDDVEVAKGREVPQQISIVSISVDESREACSAEAGRFIPKTQRVL